MRKRTVCIVTGSRADYGHLFWLMRQIKKDSFLRLKVAVTGTHLSRSHGSTYREIQRDGFRIDGKVSILRYGDSETGVTKSIGLGCRLFADLFGRMKPDIVVVLGDRYEMLAASIAAYVAKIPLVHIHGGETSQGAIDEAIRHSITKMSSLHFAATEPYRRRIIQLGEHPHRVFNVGSPALEALHRVRLLSKEALARALDFDLSSPVALVTYHPVTLEKRAAEWQIKNLLKALNHLGLRAVLTKANADAEGKVINREIEKFCRLRPTRYKLLGSMGHQKYLSCLRHFDVVIGNSSSGIIEAPSFRIPVVNIGDRQKGRLKAKNVIDVGYTVSEILSGVRKALSGTFRKALRNLKNPYVKYRDGRVSYRIKKELKTVSLNGNLLKKEFYDVTVPNGTFN